MSGHIQICYTVYLNLVGSKDNNWKSGIELMVQVAQCWRFGPNFDLSSSNNAVHYGPMVVYGYLHITLRHYQHYADLSKSIELLKCLSDIFCLKCVSKIRSVLPIIFHAIYGAVCIQLTYLSYDDCENTCAWSNHHPPIGSMTHLPLFRVGSWNNGMRCMYFYFSMDPRYSKSDF